MRRLQERKDSIKNRSLLSFKTRLKLMLWGSFVTRKSKARRIQIWSQSKLKKMPLKLRSLRKSKRWWWGLAVSTQPRNWRMRKRRKRKNCSLSMSSLNSIKTSLLRTISALSSTSQKTRIKIRQTLASLIRNLRSQWCLISHHTRWKRATRVSRRTTWLLKKMKMRMNRWVNRKFLWKNPKPKSQRLLKSLRN